MKVNKNNYNAYCALCNKNVDVIMNYKTKKYKDDIMDIEYESKIAVCSECGEELFIDEISKYNQEMIKQKYQEKYEIITTEEIKEIMTKYNIGKRPLSLLLGFGEITITRYLSGYIPTPKNSKILKQILNSPSDYYSLLQANKHTITDIAFKKSEETTKKILNISFNDNMIEEVSKYIVNKIEVSNLALQKLLYYIQVFYSAIYGKIAFLNKCSAWDYGPVYGNIYYKYKQYGKGNIIDEMPTEIFETDLKTTIDYVVKYFGCFTGTVLMAFTHKEEPWLKAIKTENKIVEKNDIITFGKNIVKEYNIQSIQDINKYSQSMLINYLNNL